MHLINESKRKYNYQYDYGIRYMNRAKTPNAQLKGRKVKKNNKKIKNIDNIGNRSPIYKNNLRTGFRLNQYGN